MNKNVKQEFVRQRPSEPINILNKLSFQENEASFVDCMEQLSNTVPQENLIGLIGDMSNSYTTDHNLPMSPKSPNNMNHITSFIDEKTSTSSLKVNMFDFFMKFDLCINIIV